MPLLRDAHPRIPDAALLQYQGCCADGITLTLEVELSEGRPAPPAEVQAANGAGACVREE